MRLASRRAVLWPALFALIVVPIAIFAWSGAGTHMSAILLYLPASPWWLLFLPLRSVEAELRALLAGCAINLAFLALLGFAWDRMRAAAKTNRSDAPPR